MNLSTPARPAATWLLFRAKDRKEARSAQSAKATRLAAVHMAVHVASEYLSTRF
jgi:hypothetical protein